MILKFCIIYWSLAAVVWTRREQNRTCGTPPKSHGTTFHIRENEDPALYNGSTFPHGHTIRYRCGQGFSTTSYSGSMTECKDGTWTPMTLQCTELTCGALNPPSNGRRLDDNYNIGSYAMFACNPGYNLQGPSRLLCRVDGEWNPREPPRCIPVKCPDVSEIANGRSFQENWQRPENEYQNVIRYTCDEGYSIEGSNDREARRVCQADGTWSGSMPQCTTPRCPEIPLGNGTVTYFGDREIYTLAFFTCNTDFDLSSKESTECEKNLQWVEMPSCITRLKPWAPFNGNASTDDPIKNGESYTLCCNDGFLLYHVSRGDFLRNSVVSVDSLDCVEVKNILGELLYNRTDQVRNLKCKDARCKTPSIENGKLFHDTVSKRNPVFNETYLKHGNKVRMQCDNEYKLFNLINQTFLESEKLAITCNLAKLIPDPLPRCILPKQCRAEFGEYTIVTKGNDNRVEEDNNVPHNIIIRIKCEDGIWLRPNLTNLECFNGNWRSKGKVISELPACRPVMCSVQGVRGTLLYTNDTEVTDDVVPHRTTGIVRCPQNYSYEDEDNTNGSVQCNDGVWEPDVQCVKQCTRPTIDNAAIEPIKDVFSHKEKIHIKCEDGIRLRLNSTHLECSNGIWRAKGRVINVSPACRPDPCRVQDISGELLFTNDTEVTDDVVPHRFIGIVQCPQNYSYADYGTNNGSVQCKDGIWEPVVQCAQQCQRPNMTNAVIEPDKETFTHNEQIFVACKDGYDIEYENSMNGFNDNDYAYDDNFDNAMTTITKQFRCNYGNFDIKHKCNLKQDVDVHAKETTTVKAITSKSAANRNTTDRSHVTDVCQLPAVIEPQLTIYDLKKRQNISANSSPDIKHGTRLEVNCSPIGTTHYEPYRRVFECDTGSWVVKLRKVGEWSFENNGSFPKCRPVICPKICCKFSSYCVRDYECDCPKNMRCPPCEQPVCSGGCLNGGSCIKSGTCNCTDGYNGTNCQQAVCSGSCLHGGSCIAPDTCKCQDGFIGTRCQQDVDECAPNPCMYGATCNNLQNDYSCKCTPGWQGKNCDQAEIDGQSSNKDPCNSIANGNITDRGPCKSIANGNITDRGQSVICDINHSLVFSNDMDVGLYARYSCTCDKTSGTVSCMGSTVACKPNGCPLPSNLEPGLTLYDVKEHQYISAANRYDIPHGGQLIFNCAPSGDKYYEPSGRTFACCKGSWVGQQLPGEEWSFDNKGTFPKCRPVTCPERHCQFGGHCIQDFKCQCPQHTTGQHCEQPVCIKQCANGGSCTGPNHCTCKEGFDGSSCENRLSAGCAKPESILVNLKKKLYDEGERISITGQSCGSGYLPNSGDMTLTCENGQWSKKISCVPAIAFTIRVATADVQNAGTDGDVYIRLVGTEGDTGNIDLKGSFERNTVDVVYKYLPDVGNITTVYLGVTSRNPLFDGWRPSHVTIGNRRRNWFYSFQHDKSEVKDGYIQLRQKGCVTEYAFTNGWLYRPAWESHNYIRKINVFECMMFCFEYNCVQAEYRAETGTDTICGKETNRRTVIAGGNNKIRVLEPKCVIM